MLGQTYTLTATKPPAPGPGYIWIWDPAQGKHVWLKCPTFMAMPMITTGNLAGSIAAIRAHYDWWFALLLNTPFGQVAPVKMRECPGYRDYPIVSTLNSALGNAVAFPLFRRLVWAMVMPGQIAIEGMVDVKVHSGVGPGAQFGVAWTGGKQYQPQPRQPAARVAVRIAALKILADAFRSQAFPKAGLWPTWSSAVESWVLDFSLPDQEVLRRLTRLAQIVKAASRAPWPHLFMYTFIAKPKVAVGPLFGNFRVTDPAIVTSGYFPRSETQIEADLARMIVQNESAFNEHFRLSVEEWIAQLQADMEREMEAAEKREKILSVIFVIVGIVGALAGAGLLVSAISTISQSALQVYNVKKLTSAQVDAVRQLMKIMNIDESKLDRFRTWVQSKVSMAPEAPPTPSGVEGVFSAYVEGNLVATGNDVTTVLNAAAVKSKLGDRVVLKNERTGEAERVFLRESKALREVPPSVAAKAQVISHEASERVAAGKGSPLLLLIPVIPALL